MTRVITDARPSTTRLRMTPARARRTHLDGGWWPRSTDPAAEVPGLVRAIDDLRGPVTRLILAAEGWKAHPDRLSVGNRVLRLGYFHSQPISLLTALCANGDRVDLLVVPPDTAEGIADAAMILATATDDFVSAPHILATVSNRRSRLTIDAAVQAWETEGGCLGTMRRIAVPNKWIGRQMTHIDKAEIITILRSRGLHDRADWFDREFAGLVDTQTNASLLRMLHIDPEALSTVDVNR